MARSFGTRTIPQQMENSRGHLPGSGVTRPRHYSGAMVRFPARRVPFLLVISVVILADIGCRESTPPTPPAAAVAPPDSAESGTVVGVVPRGNSGMVVELRPDAPVAVPPGAPPVLDQVQMTFSPDLVVTQTGGAVEFRSSDTELHNLNIRNAETHAAELNHSMMPGSRYQHVFPRSGFYDVRCDIHPAMSATIYVADSPYVTSTQPDGSFMLANVPPGHYTVTVYRGADVLRHPVDVQVGQNVVAIADTDEGTS